MKNAPFACPKCKEKEKWICLNDPTVNTMRTNKTLALLGGIAAEIPVIRWIACGLGVVSLVPGIAARLKQLWNNNVLVYRCEKCGYKGYFKPDGIERDVLFRIPSDNYSQHPINR